MAGQFHLEQMPQKFRTRLVNENTLRAALQNETDITEWVNEFSKISHTQWIFRRSRIGKHIIFKEYLCHHSGYRKVLKDENGCNRKGLSKNKLCLARIKISLDVVRSKRSSDPFTKTGLYATIRIDRSHTHTLNSPQTLRFLQDQNSVLRDTFYEYFDDCMTATEAKRFHEHKLVLKNVKQEDFANGRVNPTRDTVNYWFKQWRLLNSGPRTREKLIAKLEEKKEIYAKVGVILEYTTAPFSLLVLTPIMIRAHQLPSSANLVFIDTTSTCDADSHSVTFVLSPCVAGAVPLAVLITSGQSEESYSAAFNLMKTTLPEAFGDQRFPNTTFTDNTTAEINAIKNTWPDTKHLLCNFHVLQAVWRWLSDGTNNIESDDRIELMNSFKKLMYAEQLAQADEAYNDCLQCGAKYHKWIKYIGDYWKIKEKWVLSYRNEDVRGNHAHHFAEATMQIFKDVVLSKVKAYNVITIVDIIATALEDYYSSKLRDFANFGGRSSFSFFWRSMEKISYLQADDIVQISDFLFLVPSEKNPVQSYTVDCEVGSCSCIDGKYGRFCKHQNAIHQYFNIFSADFPPITKEDRYKIAQVALRENAPDISYYDEFEIVKPSESMEVSPVPVEITIPPTLKTTMIVIPSAQNNEPLLDEYQEAVQSIFQILKQKFENYTTRKNTSDIQKFLKTIQKISSKGEFLQFLNSVPTHDDVHLHDINRKTPFKIETLFF